MTVSGDRATGPFCHRSLEKSETSTGRTSVVRLSFVSPHFLRKEDCAEKEILEESRD